MIKIGLTDYTPSDKIIEIRDKNQIIKAKYAISATDILKYTLMSEHYIEISFEFNQYIAFKRSDYILWNGSKFTLREDYIPEQQNKYKYNYTLKFEATEMLFQDIQFYYLNQSLKESEWRLAGNPAYFIKIAVDNANRYFGVTDFTIGTIEPTGVNDIIFDTNTNTFDALTQIAEAYEAEWYMTGKTINLVKKVSFGAEVDFETEVSVLSMSRSEGENSTRYTRILALGSTRNLPKDYRAASPGEAVDAVYPKRLRIPAAKGDVINAYSNMSPEEVVEGTVIFDEVYPKRVGSIEAIGTIEYKDTDEDTGEVTKWNAFKFKDSGIVFKEEYILPGEELRLSFQSGDLNGFDFALKFHKDGFSSSDSSQYFEIVRSEDYGKKLPNDTMKPKAGDKYVLYGFNIALVSDQYVPAGELELFDTASAWIQKQLDDTSVYECPTVIDHFKKNEMDLEIGQKVKLILDHIDISVRLSRIMGYKKKLYNIYDATYTVGDNSTYSRLDAIEKEIKELQYAGVVYENTGTGGVYVIKQFDTTTPTDFNTYSAKASEARYLNKQTGGSVAGDTLFQKNMQVLGSAISDVFQNSTFTAGQLGSGFQIKRDANGQSYMEIDNLMVRREAVFNRLTIAEIKSVGGTILLSLANMLISKVEDKASGWRCYFDNSDGTIPNDFAVDDQVICRKFTGKNVKYYWSKVLSVGVDFIEISKSDKDGSGTPAASDEVVQLGNRTDVNRQSAIMLSAYGSDAPSIKQYAGINSYDLTGKEVTAISPKGNKFTGSFSISTNGTTSPIYKDRDGGFQNGTTYYLNDRISYLGAYWVCVVNSTVQTPSETSLAWKKETTSQKDIDSAVNNLEIGVSNLLLRTKDFSSNWGKNVGASLTNNYYKDLRIAKLAGAWQYYYQPYTFEAGATYTLSAYVKAETAGIQLYVTAAGVTSGYVSQNVALEWTRYSWTFTAPQATTATIGFLIPGAGSDKVIYVCGYKLEKGNKATDWSEATEDVQARIDAAQKAANNAKTVADKAQTDTDAANSLLADIANDNKFVPSEKQEVKREWDAIVSEYAKNIAQANNFSVATTTYTTTYNSLSSYITPLLSNLNVTSDIVGTTFRSTFKNYYDARLDLLNAIAKKAKDLADTAQNTANNAIEKVTMAESSISVLQNEIKLTVKQTEFNSLAGRVSTAESNITQQAGLIASTVEKVDKKNAAYKSYTELSTDRPSVPYSKGDLWITYDGRILQAANTRLSGAFIESDWKDTTKYTDDSAVNNLEIGVSNLLLRTKDFSSNWGKNVGASLTNNYYKDLRIAKLAGAWQYYYQPYTFEAGATYTLSAYVKAETAGIQLYVTAAGVTSGYVSQNVALKWTRYSWTFTAPQATTATIGFLIPGAGSDKVIYVCGYKLEKGNKATDWSEATEDVQARIDAAQKAANNAKTVADKAQTDTDAANSLLADIASDNKFDPSEKQSTKKEWDAIVSEYSKNISQANSFGVATAAYTTAYNALSGYITPLLANLNITSDIVGATFRMNFKNYYDARLDLLNAVSVKAKQLADAAQNTANNANKAAQDAQNTADSKNRSYYSDTVPVAPSGGHKVGDLWYKISLTDECYTSYRWNGTTWQIINVNVSKSRIEQTDSRITSVVEKTGIDSLGNGETLYSKINQTANEIRIEVNNIQIGGSNLLLRTKDFSSYWGKGTGASLTNNYYKDLRIAKLAGPWQYYYQPYTFEAGATYTLSAYVKAETAGIQLYVTAAGVTSGYVSQNVALEWTRYSWTFTAPQGVAATIGFLIPGAGSDKVIYVCGYKLEKGNKATDWSPNPNDIPDMVGSSLSLTDNKISLASTTIELKGNTIAKAIRAESLNVNSKAIINTDGSASFGGGSTVFNVDGSGKTANGNISWNTSGDLSVTGKFESNRNGDRINIDASTRSLKLIGSDGVVYGNLSFQNRDGQIYPMISFNNTNKSMNAFLSYKSLDVIENSKSGSLSPAGLDIIYNDGPVLNSNYNRFTVQAEASGVLKVIALGLPTSKVGLATGQLWRDGDTIKIIT